MIVGFSNTTHLLSRFIALVTRSKATHAWLRFPIFGRMIVFQSDWRGVGMEDWERFKTKHTIVAEFDVQIPFDRLMPKAVSDLGARYDILGFIGEGWVLLGNLFKKHWGNPLKRKDQWYCSELVAALLQDAGEKLPANPECLSPADLLQFIVKSESAQEKIKTPILAPGR